MKPKTIIAAIIVFAILLAVGGGLAYWKYMGIKAAMAAPPMPEPPQAVDITEARTVKWQPTVDLSGTVIALQSVMLSNEVAGTVREVLFESGAIVEKDQVLVTLDTSTEDAQLRSEEANVKVSQAQAKVAEADVALAEANVQRIRQAAEARATSAAELDSANSAVAAARARQQRVTAEIEQSQAKADQLRATIAKKTLRAPFKAHAGLRNIHPGQYLAEGASVVGLQSVSDRIYLDFALPQELATQARPGMVVMAKAPMLGNEPIRIEVVALDATANPTTRNVRVRAVVPNTNQALRPGMFVDITAPYGESRDQVVVPSTAVRRATFGDHVFVIAPDDKDPNQLRARQRNVKTGPMIGTDLVILDGLKAGERIAADGSFKLHENAPVMPGAAPSGAEPPQQKASANP